MLDEIILPDPEQMHLDQVHLDQQFLELIVTTKANTSSCPTCGVSSTRVHSHYQREIMDLPFAGFIVRLHWRVRRFFCDNPDCPKVTFAEQIPSIKRYARKTNRLVAQQTEVAFAVGGEPGARLAARLQIPTSPDTLLRHIQNALIDTSKTPQYLGVDDWAIRKRHTYGTILVDLETHRPVDLLPERSAETLSNWLKVHPGVKIVSRDRSSEYAKGATEGAPDAVQVADRWHLLVNLREAVELFFEQNRACLYATAKSQIQPELVQTQEPEPPSNSEAVESKSIPDEDNLLLTKVEQARALHREKRLRRYNEVISLYQQGVGIREIARQMKMARKTITKYIRAGELPEIGQRRKMSTQISPYKHYLEERWQAGCHNRMQLWREICEQGFTGAHMSVYIWARQKGLEKESGSKPIESRQAKKSASKKVIPWSTSRAAWLLFKSESDLKPEESIALEKMKTEKPNVGLVLDLVHEFQSMTRNRQVEKLPGGLQRVNDSEVEPLKGFGHGIQADRKAVDVALSLCWSNGVTEGNVNRLKLIKRQMFGRASFSLLRQRVLQPTVAI
jgi:transposase